MRRRRSRTRAMRAAIRTADANWPAALATACAFLGVVLASLLGTIATLEHAPDALADLVVAGTCCVWFSAQLRDP